MEKVSGSQIVEIDKRKYLVPSDITVAQFMWIIRKRIQMPSEKAIYLFVDKTVPQSRSVLLSRGLTKCCLVSECILTKKQRHIPHRIFYCLFFKGDIQYYTTRYECD